MHLTHIYNIKLQQTKYRKSTEYKKYINALIYE